MQRVIVTGATSMIGVATIEECINHNVEVVAVLRKNSNREYRLPKSSIIKKIYADSTDFPNVLYTEGADVLYNFMWEFSHKAGRDDPLQQEKNILLTLKVIEFAKKNGCKRVVFAGSQAEYGQIEGNISEKNTPKPELAYGIAKYSACMLAEKMCKQNGIEFVWGRIFSVYGKYDNDDTMISTTINKLLKRQMVKFSSGIQSWNFLNEKDAGCIFYKLGNSTVAQGIYNIANPYNKQLKDYIMEILKFFPNGEYAFEEQTGNEKGIAADTTKLFAQIGEMKCISFSDGINEIIQYKRL